MDIKVKYWKLKRAFNKRKELFGRIISVSLTVLLVVLLGIAAFRIHQSDLQRAADASASQDDSAIKIEPGWDYGESGFQQVAENDKLILSADYTTGEICVTEKASGKQWFSNPQDRADDKLVAMRSRLNAQLHVQFVDMESLNVQQLDNYAASIRKGGMEHELVENGVKFTFAFPAANVYIPVQYTLCDDGFQAEIITDEIKRVGSKAFMVESIALLPYFGAGGLEDDGYLLIPDGSGALIDFNNNRQTTQAYSAVVYGTNPTLIKSEQEAVKETVTMPVFGIKSNDHAVLGVIISGESSSSISASTSRKTNSYNFAYSSAIVGDYSKKTQKGNKFALNESRVIDYREDLFGGKNYAVRYFFLEGEEADYSGMSKCYREFLEERDLLKKSTLSDDKYMVLDLIGAVSIQKYVVGIKMPVVTALTTYNDVCEIVKELKAQGVDKLIVNYVGALDSGLNNRLYNGVKTESVLGTKKEFRQMISYLEEQGVLLFMETNPVDLYENGNGYKENRDSVKGFFNQYAFQYKYKLDSKLPVEDSRWHLLRPQLVFELVSDFTDSALEWNINNISIDKLGEMVYSNYATGDNAISRVQALDLWNQALQTVGEKAEYLMVHGGNSYCAPYADIITDTSDSSSNYDMQNQSIPFYQMTFQDNLVLTSNAINTTVDYDYAVLKALETGCNLKLNLIYGDVANLVGTDYNDMVSYSFAYWKDIAVEKYRMLQDAALQFAGEEIVAHEILDTDVAMTTYESGKVIVNYRDEAYVYNGMEIGARDYLIVSGGAK